MFGKNTKKLNYRVRFQNSRFRRQLEQARGYKRPTRKLPQTNWGIFLSKIGLGSWLSRLTTFLVFGLLVYLVFVPNPFFVKQVTIAGVDGQNKVELQNLVKIYLEKKLPWPQKNLLILSKSGLKSYLLTHSEKIVSVDSINKKLPGNLVLKLSPRVDKFVIQAGDKTYILSNDGLLTQQLQLEASSSVPSGLGLIKLTMPLDINLGQNVLSQEQVNFLLGLQNALPNIVKAPINFYSFADLKSPDFNLLMQDGLKLMFDSTADLNDSLNQFKQLFLQFTAADIKNLAYIDMRFKDKAYVCYINTPCVNPVNVPSNSTATTSPAVHPK